MPRAPRKKKHRPHKPAELGPRVYLRGRFYWCDLRPFGGQRVPMRNPKAIGWPAQGEGTEDPEVAARWAFQYFDAIREATTRKQLGKRAAAKPLGVEVERYLAHAERMTAETTAMNHSTALRVHFVPFVGPAVGIDAVEHALVQRWVDGLLGRGYALGTVDNYLSIVRTFFRWQSDGASDPTKAVRLPGAATRDVEPFTDPELVRLREAADALDAEAPAIWESRLRRSYRLLLELGLGTGARLGELSALRWDAFDYDTRTVRITAQAPLTGANTPLRVLKGKASRTALTLPTWWEWYALHSGDTAKGCVLSSDPHASHTSLASTDRWAGAIIERAKLAKPGRGAHAFRHTYARLFIEMGGRLEELQKSLGHSSIIVTERTYGWLSGDRAATLARARIYGETLTLVAPRSKVAR